MEKMDQLIKQMLEIQPDIVLGLEDHPKVTILPAIVTKENCFDVGKEHIGQIEYQVSDGPVYLRSISFDVFQWSEVEKAIVEVEKQIKT